MKRHLSVNLYAGLDTFFASVEQQYHPKLQGKPIVVRGSGPRGVVTEVRYFRV